MLCPLCWDISSPPPRAWPPPPPPPPVLPCPGPLPCPPPRLAVGLSYRTCSDLGLPGGFRGFPVLQKDGPRERKSPHRKQAGSCLLCLGVAGNVLRARTQVGTAAGWEGNPFMDHRGHRPPARQSRKGWVQAPREPKHRAQKAACPCPSMRLGARTQMLEPSPPHSKSHPFPSSDKCFTNSLF